LDAPGLRAPCLDAPQGATDTHMHVYEPGYAMAKSALIAPPPGALADYRKVQTRLGLERVVIVQPSSYGIDNRCTLEAVAKLGEAARCVVTIDEATSDDELATLTQKGARGIRFFMLPGGAVPWEILDRMAARTHEHGWHVQLQLDGRTLPDRLAQLKRLPGGLVIDHVGRFHGPVAPDHAGVKALFELVDLGAWVKLSAPYESSREGPPVYGDVGKLATALAQRAPERMLWASNWPHPSWDPRPDDAMMLDTLLHWIEDETVRRRILVDNPAGLYGFT
jgi:D-galactarolactone isomerase